MKWSRFLSRNWLTFYAVVYMLVLYLPVVLLPLFAFNASTIIAFPMTGFTFEWFGVLLRLRPFIVLYGTV